MHYLAPRTSVEYIQMGHGCPAPASWRYNRSISPGSKFVSVSSGYSEHLKSHQLALSTQRGTRMRAPGGGGGGRGGCRGKQRLNAK